MKEWDAGDYAEQFSYVWKKAEDLIDLLAPKRGERILDLGCGTGELTAKLAESGASVVGLDASASMIGDAKKRFPAIPFLQADARTFSVPDPFDAVFSNAALHWIKDAKAVARSVFAALKPGGRFVGEFGGKGNVRRIDAAIEAGLHAIGRTSFHRPWYFPTIPDYAAVLEGAGFDVTFMTLFERPTPLQGDKGLAGWIEMFASEVVATLSPVEREPFLRAAEAYAKPFLFREGQWFADYRRLRFVAFR